MLRPHQRGDARDDRGGGGGAFPDGEIAVRLLEDVGADAAAAIDREAARMSAWYGDVRAIPRFRTPLERELTA